EAAGADGGEVGDRGAVDLDAGAGGGDDVDVVGGPAGLGVKEVAGAELLGGDGDDHGRVGGAIAGVLTDHVFGDEDLLVAGDDELGDGGGDLDEVADVGED